MIDRVTPSYSAAITAKMIDVRPLSSDDADSATVSYILNLEGRN